jgi:hypothetical protein
VKQLIVMLFVSVAALGCNGAADAPAASTAPPPAQVSKPAGGTTGGMSMNAKDAKLGPGASGQQFGTKAGGG